MRAVVQRVSRAEVRVSGVVVGSIGRGLVVLLGVRAGDGEPEAHWLADKIVALRVFEGAAGAFDRSLVDVEGALLAISQFTLYGDCRKGRRPSFADAAAADVAESLYEAFVRRLRASGRPVETGVFGAMMEVELVNDGPVTLTIERDPP